MAALFEANAAEMERLDVGAGYMFLTIGTTGFLIEPVFCWPDAQEALHRHAVEPAHLARLRDHGTNPAARALVEQLRAEIVAFFGRLGPHTSRPAAPAHWPSEVIRAHGRC